MCVVALPCSHPVSPPPPRAPALLRSLVPESACRPRPAALPRRTRELVAAPHAARARAAAGAASARSRSSRCPRARSPVPVENVNTGETATFCISAGGSDARPSRPRPSSTSSAAAARAGTSRWPTACWPCWPTSPSAGRAGSSRSSRATARPPSAPATRSHFAGHAIDLRVRGVRTAKVRDFVWREHHEVGVGHYAVQDFVHVDSRPGAVRHRLVGSPRGQQAAVRPPLGQARSPRPPHPRPAGPGLAGPGVALVVTALVTITLVSRTGVRARARWLPAARRPHPFSPGSQGSGVAAGGAVRCSRSMKAPAPPTSSAPRHEPRSGGCPRRTQSNSIAKGTLL